MSDKKTTRHWLESRLEHGWLRTRLICEHPTACAHTSKDSDSCAVVDFHDNGGLEDLVPSTAKATFGRVEVAVEWEGWEDEAYPELTPVPPAPAVTRDDLTAFLAESEPLLHARAARLLANELLAKFDIRLRPTEGSDTDGR